MFDFLKGNPRDKWIVENVRFYRSLGFFADLGKMKERQLVEAIKKRLSDKIGPTREFDGLEIAAIDVRRVWKQAPVDYNKDQNFFARAMDEWSAISRGILRPLKVTIDFNHGTGRQTLIQFTQDSMLHSMYAHTTLPNWLDPAIFDQFNAIFGTSGFRFESGDLPDGSKVVVVVTPMEKQKLAKERNWRFNS